MFDSVFKRLSHLGHEIIMIGQRLSRSLLKNAWHRDRGCKGNQAWIVFPVSWSFYWICAFCNIWHLLGSSSKPGLWIECLECSKDSFLIASLTFCDFFFPHSHYVASRFTTGRWTTRTRRKRWRSSFCPRQACDWKTWPATRTTWSNCLRLTQQEMVHSVSPGEDALFSQVRLCLISLQYFISLYTLLPALPSAKHHSLNGLNHKPCYVQQPNHKNQVGCIPPE